MPLSTTDLEKIARLACLDTANEQTKQLHEEINSIMDFVEQLCSVDTHAVRPLCHPLALHQRLRPDEVTEVGCVAELEALAPQFADTLYLVPNVFDADK
jgi:aspartyl-tRNA(Asn)/glutamyl-tRNA(Gln) amidotransferase subunit C